MLRFIPLLEPDLAGNAMIVGEYQALIQINESSRAFVINNEVGLLDRLVHFGELPGGSRGRKDKGSGCRQNQKGRILQFRSWLGDAPDASRALFWLHHCGCDRGVYSNGYNKSNYNQK